jgi:hypothetical protein
MAVTINLDVGCYGNHISVAMATAAVARQGYKAMAFFGSLHMGAPFSNGLNRIDFGKSGAQGIGTYVPGDFFKMFQMDKLTKSTYKIRCAPSSQIETYARLIVDEAGGLVCAGSDLTGTNLNTVTLVDGTIITATKWIDCDENMELAHMGGCPSESGRDGNDAHSETLSGIQIYPEDSIFVAVPGGVYDDDDELLYGLVPFPTGYTNGDPDTGVSNPGWRHTVTDDYRNQIAWPKSANYEASKLKFELLRRISPIASNSFKPINVNGSIGGHKVDVNNVIISPLAAEYPNATFARKLEIRTEWREVYFDWLWFCANDPSVSSGTREFMYQWRPCADEYQDDSETPVGIVYEPYLRGGRRLAAALDGAIMLQKDAQTDLTKTDAGSMGFYTFDAKPVWLYPFVKDGVEGYIEDTLAGAGNVARNTNPYQWSMKTAMPTAITNMLVANAVCSSFVWMCSGRIDIDKMHRAACCGLLAAESIRLGKTFAQMMTAPYLANFQALLVSKGQVLELPT